MAPRRELHQDGRREETHDTRDGGSRRVLSPRRLRPEAPSAPLEKVYQPPSVGDPGSDYIYNPPRHALSGVLSSARTNSHSPLTTHLGLREQDCLLCTVTRERKGRFYLAPKNRTTFQHKSH